MTSPVNDTLHQPPDASVTVSVGYVVRDGTCIYPHKSGRQDGYRTFSSQFSRSTANVIHDVQSTYVIDRMSAITSQALGSEP